jgi:bifunctional UDP-N-acetylglucosamine pyrophosphorylase/glucosamine-1-phosphate N-acetyltransferase
MPTRAIREINTGIIAAPTAALARWLPTLGNDNAQGEYYLTDIVRPGRRRRHAGGDRAARCRLGDLGVNSKVQLAELERIHQRNNALLMEQRRHPGRPRRIDVRGELVCGRDVTIDVNCVFEGRVVLGDGVEVGANCVLKNAVIGAGTRIAPFSHIEDAEVGPAASSAPMPACAPARSSARTCTSAISSK